MSVTAQAPFSGFGDIPQLPEGARVVREAGNDAIWVVGEKGKWHIPTWATYVAMGQPSVTNAPAGTLDLFPKVKTIEETAETYIFGVPAMYVYLAGGVIGVGAAAFVFRRRFRRPRAAASAPATAGFGRYHRKRRSRR